MASASVMRAFLSSAWGDPDTCLVIELSLNSSRQAPRPHASSGPAGVGPMCPSTTSAVEAPSRRTSGAAGRDSSEPVAAPAPVARAVRRAALAGLRSPVDVERPRQVTDAGREPPGAVRRTSRAELDTGTIERVLNALEPVDQTTSFEHEPTARLPMLRAEPPTTAGKRRAVKHAGGRGPAVQGLPLRARPAGHRRAGRLDRWRRDRQRPQPAASGSGRDRHPRGVRARRLQRHGQGRRAASDQISRDSDRDAQADAAGPDAQERRRPTRGEAAQRRLLKLAGQGRGAGQVPRQEPVESTRSSRSS